MPKQIGALHYQKAFAVTSTAQSALAAKKIARDVFIQNNHATAIVYVNLSGDAVVQNAGMFKIWPTGMMTWNQITNAVSVIGDIASNADVCVSEGRHQK